MALFDRIAAVLLGLGLLILGILVPAEIVHTVLLKKSGQLILPWQTLTRFLTGHDWSTSPMLAISGVAAGLGLVLLLAELKRRRPGLLTLRTQDEHLSIGTPRRSLSRALAAQARQVDGVSSASVKLGRRSATVDAVTGQRDPGELRQQLADRLTSWLESLGLVRTPNLRVRLKTREDR